MVNYTSTATILLSLLSTSSTISAASTTNNNNGAKFNLRKRIIGRPINTNNQHKLSTSYYPTPEGIYEWETSWIKSDM